MKTIRTLILCLLGLVAAASASAADFYARGVAHCILDDGTGNFPVAEAGEVFVSTTADATPQWTAGTFTSATISGPHSTTMGSSVSFYFWARAKAGYTFIGWATSKTSKTPSSGTADLEGQPWSSKTTFWSAKTEAAPNELVRYAIFRKNAAEDTTGGGVPLSNIVGDTHTFGSTTGEWSVRLNYREALAYRDFAGYSDGYGVNTALISAITCTEKTSGNTVSVKNARVGGSPTASPIGSDAYGVVFFPADMPVGTYNVHVPKALFTTATGSVTAAADFVVTVTPDDTPFVIESTSPAANYAWDASEATQAKETDGIFSTITVTFNKNIARVVAEGKNIVLTNTTSGRVSNFTFCSVSATTNKHLGVISFDNQPNGSYVFNLPKDVFFDASGKGNEPLTLKFSIKGSKLDAWELPTYSTIVATPSNNSTVDELKEVAIAFSRPGYAQPQQLFLNAEATAAKVKEIYQEGASSNDPDVLPEIESEDIEGVTLAFEDGLLKVRFAQPIREAAKVVVGVPAKAVINLDARPDTPLKTLYEEGGCTNAPVQLTIIVKPSILTGLDVSVATEQFGEQTIFTADGKRVSALQPGVNIVRTTSANGEVNVRKVIVK